ncbi:uncharacterized methyltransferase-like C25B8.10 isoform X1 [Pecten maximus]|uniref:uncharacterized methyltransferase-like C25B8.10 isoform X1 n=1 Tax=Pecten maximus TaxID=6579 RepID=UPI00145830D8|nr:uncharacterized methyltransferase-like C25B8.10 isoform X1 [Pecten maximus]
MSTDTRLHALVRDGFTDGARYDKHRPTYTDESITWVLRKLSTNFEGLHEDDLSSSECDILELGAGTGLFTKSLSKMIPEGRKFISSEPMPDFFSTLKRNCLTVETKQFPAESIPLPDNSVQGIVAAQSFHWFANEKALSEMLRVLKPRGNIVLIWNIEDRRTDWVKALREVYNRRELIPETVSYYTFKWKEVLNNDGGIAHQESKTLDYPSQGYTADGIVEMYSTLSGITQMSPDDKQCILAELRDLLRTHPDTAGKETLYLPRYTDLEHYIKL